ncbi:hypothetical protein GCM10011321_21330 [Youhaiella tibetensis]|uniref:SH3 domain-containing protein n=1 Tax=Paradevosia tibetensis TaxID=1447062 RepID=A0A5B9DLM5_9HYPH|nr:SH3 domain-containing protein [Youhaiella tibetensis]QEE19812.1 SH3 domain-containing protein [Youhaiella tibetensis]GGF29736.1 hypothetical protein GCM10011321_21330 [Youhaiella tibetensis]
MNKRHEQLLVATLAGLVILSAAAFAVQPAMAAGYNVDQQAQVTGVAKWDRLNVRKWPAAYSQKVGSFQLHTIVWVERCIEATHGSDWCLVERGFQKGWVNSSYLTLADDLDI